MRLLKAIWSFVTSLLTIAIWSLFRRPAPGKTSPRPTANPRVVKPEEIPPDMTKRVKASRHHRKYTKPGSIEEGRVKYKKR